MKRKSLFQRNRRDDKGRDAERFAREGRFFTRGSVSQIEEDRTLIPVTVLTGFLGSGKTTLLAKLLLRPELADSAVLVNEVGEVAIDHHLVRKVRDEMVVMANGCLCCRVRSDLVDALRGLLFNRGRNSVARYPRVFIETSGLAEPAPVLHALTNDPYVLQHYRLDGIVATVDAMFGASQLDRHRESVKQAAVADRLVVTKADLASKETRTALATRLRQINPGSPLLFAQHGEISPSEILNTDLASAARNSWQAKRWIAADRYTKFGFKAGVKAPPAAEHDDKVRSFVMHAERPLAPQRLLAVLEMLCAVYGDKILRVTAILTLEGPEEPQILHIVQHMVYPLIRLDAWPDDDRRSSLVFIVHDLDPAHVHTALAGVLGHAALPAPLSASTSNPKESFA